MSMSQTHNGQGSVCPQVTPKTTKSNSHLPPPLLSVSRFSQKSFLCEVVLSKMANKQSHLSTGQSTLQHFRHLFHFTACLTSAGWILLTQVYVSWTGIGALRRHNGTLPPPPPPPPATSLWRRWDRRERAGRKEQKKKRGNKIQYMCLYFHSLCMCVCVCVCVCVHNPLQETSPARTDWAAHSTGIFLSICFCLSLPASLH